MIRHLVLLILPSLLWSAGALAQSAEAVKQQEDAVRKQMVAISRQLGVTCTVCHKTDNFKSSEKMQFRVALEHIKLTQLLIDNGMDGKKSPMADCYMCHRGKLSPDYKEKIDPLQK